MWNLYSCSPEIGVASTKAFTSQVTVLFLLSLCFGRERNLSSNRKKYANALIDIGDQVKSILDGSESILNVAKSTVKADNFFI